MGDLPDGQCSLHDGYGPAGDAVVAATLNVRRRPNDRHRHTWTTTVSAKLQHNRSLTHTPNHDLMVPEMTHPT